MNTTYMNTTSRLLSCLLSLLVLAAQPARAKEPPLASSIFMNPEAARMAEDLAKGMPNAALLGRSQGVSMDARGRGGMRPIHYVTAFAHERSMGSLRALVGAGASIEMADDAGRTPLGVAAARRDGEAARVLLGFGASPSAPSEGRLPISIAIEAGNRVAFEALATSGSPLLGPAFPLGSAAREILASGRSDWLLWMSSRGMLSGRSLGSEFWRDLCSNPTGPAKSVALELSRQPQSPRCDR